MKRQSPCLNCAYREVNCHSKCNAYQNYKKLLAKDKKKREEINEYEANKRFLNKKRMYKNSRRSIF